MDYVLTDLKEKLHLATQGKLTTFWPHIMGGSGHRYTEQEINIMKKLIKFGVTIGTGPCSKSRDTPLHLAYLHNNIPMINFLKDIGADINAQRYDGLIPSEMYSFFF